MKRSTIAIVALSAALLIAGGTIYYLVTLNPFLMSKINPPKAPPSPFVAFGPDCQIAAVDSEHQFVAAAVSRGDTLTNLQLSDPNGRSTVVRVAIEKGNKPITVLLQSDTAVIWHFEGATERVARAIIVPAHLNKAAVRGLAAANVDILKLVRCPSQRMPFGNTVDQKADQIFQAYFGRAPQVIGFREAPNSISIPSVMFGSPPPNAPVRNTETKAEQELITKYPGGFRIVDAGSLITRSEITVPETYPGEAGIVQLERAGSIMAANRTDIDTFSDAISRRYRSSLSPDYRVTINFSYIVLRDLFFPPGMIGADSKNILVAAGAPPPRGNIGHGCLGFMDGFRTADDGPSCFESETADALRQLQKMPDPEAAQQCRVISVLPTASIQAVSIYRPRTLKRSVGNLRAGEPVEVRVTKPGDVVLVLNTYEPAVWTISQADNTRVVGVVLTGYYSSRIEGLLPGTPVLSLEFEKRKAAPSPTDICAQFSSYLGTAFRGGPAAIVLDRQISAITGRNIDRLRGNYALERVLID